jgi:hypothetical protein
MTKRVFTAITIVLTAASGAGAAQWQHVTADIHVTKSSIPGGTTFEIVDKSGDHISVQIDFASKTMIVSRNFETRIVKDAQGLAAVRMLLDSSPAVQGLQKLASERDRDASPEGELIRVERMVVGLLSGETDSVKRHADQVRQRYGSVASGQPRNKASSSGSVRPGGASASTRVDPAFGALTVLRTVGLMKGLVTRGTRTRLVDATFDACWARYTAAADALVNDFAACRTGLPWYSIFEAWRCDFDYVVRAEAAWALFWACNGGITRVDDQSAQPPVPIAGCGV